MKVKLFLNRLKGAYAVLFSKRWVVMTYDPEAAQVDARFNMSFPCFQAVCSYVDAKYAELEAQDSVLDEVNKILEQ